MHPRATRKGGGIHHTIQHVTRSPKALRNSPYHASTRKAQEGRAIHSTLFSLLHALLCSALRTPGSCRVHTRTLRASSPLASFSSRLAGLQGVLGECCSRRFCTGVFATEAGDLKPSSSKATGARVVILTTEICVLYCVFALYWPSMVPFLCSRPGVVPLSSNPRKFEIKNHFKFRDEIPFFSTVTSHFLGDDAFFFGTMHRPPSAISGSEVSGGI
jgi:hypothetical protein